MLVICGTWDQTVQLKNSSQKICQIKSNSGLLNKTDTQTISFSLMIEYELSRKFYHRRTALQKFNDNRVGRLSADFWWTFRRPANGELFFNFAGYIIISSQYQHYLWIVYGRKTGIPALGSTSRRIHKSRLNSNKRQWGEFYVRKKLSYSCKPQSKIQNPTQGMLDMD